MRKLYNEFIYIPRHGKIREKVMITRVIATVTIILFCLAAMSITAYAYFSCNVSASSNVIKSASFKTDVLITPLVENSGTVSVADTDTTNHTVDLSAGEYSVKIKMADGGTATTGFCIISIGELKYHTQQIYLEESAENNRRNSIEFTLKLSGTATVSFEDRWGTSSYYADYIENGDVEEQYITNAETIVVNLAGATTLNDENALQNEEDNVNEEMVSSQVDTSSQESSMPEENNVSSNEVESDQDTSSDEIEQNEPDGTESNIETEESIQEE